MVTLLRQLVRVTAPLAWEMNPAPFMPSVIVMVPFTVRFSTEQPSPAQVIIAGSFRVLEVSNANVTLQPLPLIWPQKG